MSINCMAINCRLSTAFNRCFTENWLSLALLRDAQAELLPACLCKVRSANSLHHPLPPHYGSTTESWRMPWLEYSSKHLCHLQDAFGRVLFQMLKLFIAEISLRFRQPHRKLLTFLQAVHAGWWHDSPLSCCCFLSKWPLVYALVQRRSDCLTW